MGGEIGVLRAGVAGAGVFGGYHAQKYQHHEGVELVGVFDLDDGRAQDLASRVAAKPFGDFAQLLAVCDVVTIATPAHTHGALALQAIDAGVHVLVEKPLAISHEEALRVVSAAETAGVVVQVGHQERFVFGAMGVLDIAAVPRRVTGWRCNPFSPRGSDVSVSLDLMTHDLDLVRLLAQRSDVVQVSSKVECVRTVHPDRVVGLFRFANGLEAELTASRLHDRPARGMRLEYEDGVIEVDFVAKTLANTTPYALNANYQDSPDARDSLGAGVRRFVEAVAMKTAPAVSAQDGADAVRLALMADTAPVDA